VWGKFLLFSGPDISVVSQVPGLIRSITGFRRFIYLSGGLDAFPVNYFHQGLTVNEMPLFLHHQSPLVEIAPKIGLEKISAEIGKSLLERKN